MSRVHDALRRAEMGGFLSPDETPAPDAAVTADQRPPEGPHDIPVNGVNGSAAAATPMRLNIHPQMLGEVPVVPFQPAPESHLLDLNNTHDTPAEEFRTLRTRLNHLQTLQPLHTVVVTSPSPAEGKTFTAVNLALAQSHLAESSVLLGDFDLRRPIVHNLFQIERAPGLSDYLTGQCSFAEALRKIDGMNLYLLPAGSPVRNPLELLNMRQAKALFEELPRLFSWAIFDTPPLLFSARSEEH